MARKDFFLFKCWFFWLGKLKPFICYSCLYHKSKSLFICINLGTLAARGESFVGMAFVPLEALPPSHWNRLYLAQVNKISVFPDAKSFAVGGEVCRNYLIMNFWREESYISFCYNISIKLLGTHFVFFFCCCWGVCCNCNHCMYLPALSFRADSSCFVRVYKWLNKCLQIFLKIRSCNKQRKKQVVASPVLLCILIRLGAKYVR